MEKHTKMVVHLLVHFVHFARTPMKWGIFEKRFFRGKVKMAYCSMQMLHIEELCVGTGKRLLSSVAAIDGEGRNVVKVAMVIGAHPDDFSGVGEIK